MSARLILIGGLVVIAGGAFFWLRTPPSDSGDATPPPPQALSSTAVKTDADNAGNRVPAESEARTPQLHETVDGRTATLCRRAILRKKSAEAFNCDNVKEDDLIGQRICNDARASMQSYAERAAAEAAPCPETMAVAAEYYKAIRNAALAGKEIHRILDSSGDWGVVRWLARVSIRVPDGLLREAYPIGSEHPDTIYKMNYLILLSGRTQYLARDARAIVGVLRSNGTLSPEQIRSAEEWAQDTYRNYFAATPNTGPTGAGSFCTAE